VLHLYLQPRLRQGLDVMKFVSNHSYRFETPLLAFTVGVMQVVQIVFNEFVSFLVLMYSTDSLEIIRNFFGLVIIADFETYLYMSLRDEPVKELLKVEGFEDTCLVISRTSSSRAMAKVPENKIDEVNMTKEEWEELDMEIPKFIGIETRSMREKVMYFIYRVFRMLYVTVWFYFIPFVFVWGQYGIPLYFTTKSVTAVD
jgi:hypothetical protein